MMHTQTGGPMRERMHHAMNTSDMGWNDARIKDIDVITAMGFADLRGPLVALGGDLVVLKMSTRCKSLMYVPGQDLYQRTTQSAIERLSDVVKHRPEFLRIRHAALRRFLASLVITEYIHDRCEHCGGTGALKREDDSIVMGCPACQGGKKRIYTHAARKRFMLAQPDVTQADAAKVDKLYREKCEAAIACMHITVGLAVRAKDYITADLVSTW